MLCIDYEKCIKCGACIKRCFFNAMKEKDKAPIVGEECVLCGACAKSCPVGAIEIERVEAVVQDFSFYKGFWVIVELDAVGRVRKVSYELLSEARKLADRVNEPVKAICLCADEPEDMEEELKAIGCDELVLITNPTLKEYNTDLYAGIICGIIREQKPSAVLFAGTENGRDLAPRVSARLEVGLTADCTALDIDEEGRLVQIRPTYGGNIIASIITPNHRPQMASVRPNVFRVVHQETEGRALKVTRLDRQIDMSALRVKKVGFEPKKTVYKDVAEAEIIIAGGYGVGEKNFRLLHELAIKIGAAVGATRKAVDEGWAPLELQIGQTGQTVAPDLYIACGISGALQHSIGFKNAKRVIAINNDPLAPIFNVSDVAILGDVGQVLHELIRLVNENNQDNFM